jgi:L-fuconolactonase
VSDQSPRTTTTRPFVIDSHHHLWDTASDHDYTWLRGLDPIDKPFLAPDLQKVLAESGVDAAVLVQTIHSLDETHDFLRFAAETPEIVGVVGWVDLASPQVASQIADLKASPHGEYLVGIRHLVHNEERPDWLLQDSVQQGLQALADAGLTYDLLLRPREMESAITVARDFPHLKMVIDHIAKPPIASGELEPWASRLREFAPLEHVACKLSGMVTEADHATWTPEDLKPYVATAWEIFGPDRLMYGSDWPVCLLAAEYREVIGALRTVLDDLGVLDEASEAAVFAGTAAHWYGLNLDDDSALA